VGAADARRWADFCATDTSFDDWKKMRKIWPFTFNFLLFAATACVSPFIVLYYQGLGFTGMQIGLLTSITPLITFFSTPLWTGFADATHRHRLIMSLAILVGVITLFVFPLLDAFVSVLLIAILLNIFVAPVTSFADSAAMFMLADEKEMYGRIRLGGTIGYGLAAPIAGMLVQDYGLKFAFWGCATMFLLGFIVSQKLVYGQLKADNPARGRVRTLLTNPRWLLFLTMAFAGGSALAALNNYFFPYMKELGANESTMGLALTIGTITEIPVLFFGNRLIKRLRSYGLLMVTMVVTGIRLLLFATSGTPGLVLFIQLLNGLTFPAMWMAGVSYADENAPAGMKTTAQGLFGAMVFGFGTAVGGFIGGPLLESMGGRVLYLVFGVIVLATVAIVALIQRCLPAEQKTSPYVVMH
jgi:PPP family 3-phenylpropionic acid transporter